MPRPRPVDPHQGFACIYCDACEHGFLLKERAISDEMRSRLLGWRHFGGFCAHNRVRVAAADREGRMKLAGYMLHAPRGKGRARFPP